MGMVCAVISLLLFYPAFVLFETFLFRSFAESIAGTKVGFGMGILTVILASAAQTLFSGMFAGADGGLCGTVVGFLAWSGVATLLNGMPIARSVLVGLAMAFVHWLLSLAIVGVILFFGLAGLLGLAAL